MASRNGSQRSFETRHVFKTQRQEARSASGMVRRRTYAEQRSQARWMPGPVNELERQRQEFLLDCLLDPRVSSADMFGIIWNASCPWAFGPSIAPFAAIFDRFVIGRWAVTISQNINGKGDPGWLFERV